jgi:hypothetical protein
MFKAVMPGFTIEKDMTTAKWMDLPVTEVVIDDLIAMQDGIYLHGLYDDQESVSGDPVPHVVIKWGQQFLEDGHHRAVRAMIKGQTRMEARVLDLDK